MPGGEVADTTLIRTEGLNFSYPNRAPILKDFSLDVRRGEMVAVVGASGSGKSTLLYLLAGMLRPASGIIEVDGVVMSDLVDAQRSALRGQKFGFVFQDASLDPRRSVLDSVLEPCLYAGIKRASMIDRAKDLVSEMGVEIDLRSRPGQVSGGQAQRIAVCRALLLNPPLILADEPTGNLDRGSAEAVMTSFQRVLDGGGSVLIATHDDRVIEYCSRAIGVG